MNIQSHMKINRQMAILATIRKLQFATRRHLMSVHNMGGIRNANRILGDLKPYVNKTMQGKEYVYYLNKEGHAMFGDDGKVVSRGSLHMRYYGMKHGYIYFVQMTGRLKRIYVI